MSLNLSLTFEGHKVRMVGTPDRPQWVAKDVCRVLAIHNSRDALYRAGVKAEEGCLFKTDTPGGPQQIRTINEAGLWKLVMISRRPSALRLKQFLADDVLPCLRKHGCYPGPAKRPALPDLDLRDIRILTPLTLQLTGIVKEQQAQLTEQAPKVEAYDRFLSADGSLCLMDAGRALGRQPKLLIDQMGRDKILFRNPSGKWEPHHEYRARGLFVVRVVTICSPDGVREDIQTRVTPTGLTWLSQRYPATDDKTGELSITHAEPAAFYRGGSVS